MDDMLPQILDTVRFVEAQRGCYDVVLAELRAARKRSHWMWFIFPQLRVLGRSETALHYGLQGVAHAQAYSAHPVVGSRLRECSALLLDVRDRTAHDIFGWPDELKLCSSMTLFERAVPDDPVFAAVLERFFGGVRDPLTLAALQDSDACGGRMRGQRAGPDGVGRT